MKRGKLLLTKKSKMSGREIARKINRFKTVIYNFLKNRKEYVKKKRTGRPPTLTVLQKCAVEMCLLRKTEFYSN